VQMLATSSNSDVSKMRPLLYAERTIITPIQADLADTLDEFVVDNPGDVRKRSHVPTAP